jgi:DNA repair protein RecN (Recombination protein N)
MLKSLAVYNFALIEQTMIEFSSGLNVITGETGAGKSILIDALSCVLGDRASSDSIRTGQDFLRVEAVFDLSHNAAAIAIIDALAIPIEDIHNVIMTRRLSLAGKNTVLINGCNVPLGTLKKITENLVDIHGQHESQTLLRPEAYIAQLDAFEDEIGQRLVFYKNIFADWKVVTEKIEEAENRAQERERRLDMLSWQTQEIAAACLKNGEDEELEQQIRMLANSERIAGAVNTAYSLLNGDAGEQGGVVSKLAEIKKAVEQAVRFDPRLETQLTVICDALYQLQEVEHDLQNYFQEMEFSPERLTTLQTRMDNIYKLKKKYGSTISDILDYYQQACRELSELTDFDNHLDVLKKKHADLANILKCTAEELDALRRRAGDHLAVQVNKQLYDLGMPGAQFIVEVRRTPHFNQRGFNQVHFFFSANQGEEARPLNKVASGGELSRVALAMKAVISSRDSSGTMIFDELDAGIGGKTAQMVAEKIAFVSVSKQVLCITHLPQIAVAADCHLYIEKIVEGSRTKTVVQQLDNLERVHEIARMMSGDNQSQASLNNASNMLQEARQKKENWKNKA